VDAVAKICSRLDGPPLAIEFAVSVRQRRRAIVRRHHLGGDAAR
jgi:predicted ATPase